jgi:hypothetical protein
VERTRDDVPCTDRVPGIGRGVLDSVAQDSGEPQDPCALGQCLPPQERRRTESRMSEATGGFSSSVQRWCRAGLSSRQHDLPDLFVVASSSPQPQSVGWPLRSVRLKVPGRVNLHIHRVFTDSDGVAGLAIKDTILAPERHPVARTTMRPRQGARNGRMAW